MIQSQIFSCLASNTKFIGKILGSPGSDPLTLVLTLGLQIGKRHNLNHNNLSAFCGVRDHDYRG